jgi:Fe-S-cluster containining protein
MPEFKFELKIGEQVINASVNVPAEAIRPVDLLPILQGFSNAIVGAASTGEAVSCRAGCGACCRQVVPISETEALYLAELIEEMPSDRKATILARFADAVSRIADAGLSEKLRLESLATAEERRKVAQAYFSLGIACPFLENESCGIYDHRPLACREYLVTSPPANCATPTADSIAMVEMPKRLSYVLYQFGDGVGKAPVKFMPLTLMLGNPLPEQPRLPGPELFENFFRAAIAPPPEVMK